MDCAEEELGRIVAFVNRRPWIMESSNYYVESLGITAEGDTGLHRLCAWHTTKDQLEHFIQQMQADSNRDAPTLTQTNHQGVTCLHLAVYRNCYHANHIIQHLLHLQPSLASTPMLCGSYPLHILCGHNVTIQKDLLMDLLQADPTVVTKQDINGDTPLSLLWKNVQRFRWARQSTITLSHSTDTDNQWGPKMTISPQQCLDLSLEMIKATLNKTNLNLAEICSMPRCPPRLVQLILQLNIDFNGLDSQGRTALHNAARQDPMTLHFTLPMFYSANILDYLLDAVPWQACIKDHQGRIPLHYALAKDYALDCISDATLDRLVTCNPDCLSTKDPITGLYPFALVAMEENNTNDADIMCMDDDDEDDCPMLDGNGDNNVTQLDTIYRLLRQFPEAAIYHG